jgi:O-antigen/teichoic acid export membrane protein
LLRYGLPAAFSNLCITGLSVADRFVVKAHLGSEALAVYGASYDIAERTIFFLNTMLLLSSSVVSVQLFEQKGEGKAVEYLTHLLRIYLLGAAAIVMIMAALAPQIVALLLPVAYAEGAAILPIVAMSGMLVGIKHSYSIDLSFHKRTDVVMYCSALALVVNIAGCLLFIPRMGLLGGALATAFGYGSWLLMIRLAARRYHVPRFPWLTLVRVGVAALGAAAIMRAIVQPTMPSLVGTALLGFAIYACVLLLSGEIALAELKAVSIMVRGKAEPHR